MRSHVGLRVLVNTHGYHRSIQFEIGASVWDEQPPGEDLPAIYGAVGFGYSL